jgi:hypothetical protein
MFFNGFSGLWWVLIPGYDDQVNKTHKTVVVGYAAQLLS